MLPVLTPLILTIGFRPLSEAAALWRLKQMKHSHCGGPKGHTHAGQCSSFRTAAISTRVSVVTAGRLATLILVRPPHCWPATTGGPASRAKGRVTRASSPVAAACRPTPLRAKQSETYVSSPKAATCPLGSSWSLWPRCPCWLPGGPRYYFRQPLQVQPAKPTSRSRPSAGQGHHDVGLLEHLQALLVVLERCWLPHRLLHQGHRPWTRAAMLHKVCRQASACRAGALDLPSQLSEWHPRRPAV
mmetsp:Transcript_17747/g.34571  ORF Transcript_17747/g.34571 Transcript_17747/m.34571 type:complete len:244 (+) Transcript_17747:132-863(+)